METTTASLALERKFVPVAEFDEVEGLIAGYASIFGEPDQAGDTVVPGAFERSLSRTAREGRRIRFLWQHQADCPIGVWNDVSEDARGLRVRGQILAGLSKGAEALMLMRAEAIDGLSIGYRTVRASRNDATGGRLLHEIDLWEVSLVTFPMLPTARAELADPAPSEADVLTDLLTEALAAEPRG